MTVRFNVGDVVTITNTFKVAGVATDPTTISLAVTDPAGTTTTYTYAGSTITRTSAGLYTKNVTVSLAGTWTYVWTGTGTAADVQDGTFDVWPVASVDLLDILTFDEGKNALNSSTAVSASDDKIRQLISAVSKRIDQKCGPVVRRTVSNELHDGGDCYIWPRYTPVVSVTTLVEYDQTTGTTLSVETNASKPASGYLLENDQHLVRVWRRSSGGDSRYPYGRRNIDITYVAGRYATTVAVDEHFKAACSSILRRLWQREAGAWAQGGNPFTGEDTPGGIGFFKAIDPMINEWLGAELLPPGVG